MKKLFGTDGIRGIANKDLTAEFVLTLGICAGNLLQAEGTNEIIVGRDPRLSSDMLESALVAGLCSAGMEVWETGVITTPAVALLAKMTKRWGAMISASHNPFHDNGVKFIAPDGFKIPDELEMKIERSLQEGRKKLARPTNIGRRRTFSEGKDIYLSFLKKQVEVPLRGLKLVIDCANGSTSSFAPILFQELGVHTIPINASPNGLNINESCGSLHAEKAGEVVVQNGADAGVAFDGDGDRAIFLSEKGEVIDGDHILYILATHLQEKKKLRGPVVATIMSNRGLEEALRERGIEMIRVSVGDKYVAEKMRELNANLGGEQSGHIVLMDISPTGDGLLTAIKTLEVMLERGDALSRIAFFPLYPQKLFNARVKSKERWEENPQIKEAINFAQSLIGEEGRVHLRPSGTEPLIRIMVEAKDPLLVDRIGGYLQKVVEENLG